MFNFRPQNSFSGFRVGMPEELGFRIDQDGSVRRTFGDDSSVPGLDYDLYSNARPETFPLTESCQRSQ
jgi:hypothetical protein